MEETEIMEELEDEGVKLQKDIFWAFHYIALMNSLQLFVPVHNLLG